MIIYPHASISTHQHANVPTHQCTNTGMLVRTDRSATGFTPSKIGKVKSAIMERGQETPLVCPYCRRFCPCKSGTIIPVCKGKASTGLAVGFKVRRLRRQRNNLHPHASGSILPLNLASDRPMQKSL